MIELRTFTSLLQRTGEITLDLGLLMVVIKSVVVRAAFVESSGPIAGHAEPLVDFFLRGAGAKR